MIGLNPEHVAQQTMAEVNEALARLNLPVDRVGPAHRQFPVERPLHTTADADAIPASVAAEVVQIASRDKWTSYALCTDWAYDSLRGEFEVLVHAVAAGGQNRPLSVVDVTAPDYAIAVLRKMTDAVRASLAAGGIIQDDVNMAISSDVPLQLPYRFDMTLGDHLRFDAILIDQAVEHLADHVMKIVRLNGTTRVSWDTCVSSGTGAAHVFAICFRGNAHNPDTSPTSKTAT
jgi:hypothetical protein